MIENTQLIQDFIDKISCDDEEKTVLFHFLSQADKINVSYAKSRFSNINNQLSTFFLETLLLDPNTDDCDFFIDVVLNGTKLRIIIANKKLAYISATFKQGFESYSFNRDRNYIKGYTTLSPVLSTYPTTIIHFVTKQEEYYNVTSKCFYGDTVSKIVEKNPNIDFLANCQIKDSDIDGIIPDCIQSLEVSNVINAISLMTIFDNRILNLQMQAELLEDKGSR